MIPLAVYFITGKLGCGKTLCTVGKIRDYINQDRRVATNLDINLTALTKPDSKVSITRLPDKPQVYDLEAIGLGCVESDEKKYGLLVLDELGTWFKSRNWRDKGREEVIDWFLHARKKHWDIFFIVQNMDMLDDNLVSSLCEHFVICSRLDRINIPFIGRFFKAIGINGVLPKIHTAKVFYGQTAASMVVDRWWYRGKDLYTAYNTDQVFDNESCAVHTVLPSFYQNNIALINHHLGQIKALTPIDKRPKPPPASLKTAAIIACTLFVFFVSWRTYAKLQEFHASKNAPVAAVSPSLPVVPVSPVMPVVMHQADTMPPYSVDDYIKTITQGKPVLVSSFFKAEGRINAVLHVQETDDTLSSTFTLDDARSLGYVVILHGNVIEVRRGGYYFTFRTQSDLSG